MTWHLKPNPVSELNQFRSILNYRNKLWRAFADFLFDNDEKVASSKKKNIPMSRLECKNHTLFMTKITKVRKNIIYDQNGLKSFEAAHTYKAHIWE